MAKIENVTLGSDPEFGFADSFGNPVSAFGRLGGTKKNPEDIGNGCGVQEDGVMGEGTIPPCTSKEEFVNYIMYCKNTFDTLIKKHNRDWHCVSISSQFYSEDDLKPKEVRTFGCDPSYCVYTGSISPRPSAEEVGNLRSAGFHIHIGTTSRITIDDIEKVILLMDLYCGLPSIIIDRDEHRRKLYGNAGDFRFKITEDLCLFEYRTLGGFCHSSPELIGYFYDQTLAAVEKFNTADENFWKTFESHQDQIREAIDTGNVDLALTLTSNFKINAPKEFSVAVN